jgi:hypothetical protein
MARGRGTILSRLRLGAAVHQNAMSEIGGRLVKPNLDDLHAKFRAAEHFLELNGIRCLSAVAVPVR